MAEAPEVIVAGSPAADLERLVLGIPLIRPELLDMLISRVRKEYFTLEAHRILFEAMKGLYEKGLDITPDTLHDDLLKRNALAEIGGLPYLNRLVEHPPSVDYNQYLNRFAEAYLRRRFHTLLEQYLQANADPTTAPQELIRQLDTELNELAVSSDEKGLRKLKKPLKEVWHYLDQLGGEGVEVTGLPTDFYPLDQLTSGLQRGDLIVLAGRPSMGKTALALNIALNLARNHYKVAFFSLEMSAQQLLLRVLAIISRIELQKIRRGLFGESEWEKIGSAITQLSNLEFYIDDTAGVSVQDIRAQCRDLQRKIDGLDAVFVDYLQLLRTERRHESRQQEVTAISRHLKELAKELNAPVVALSQLSRNPDRREDNRPQLSDLRESGAIEQDADVVMFLYREEMYRPDTPRKGIAELILAKQRNGPIETLRFAFLKHIQRFEILDPRYDAVLESP